MCVLIICLCVYTYTLISVSTIDLKANFVPIVNCISAVSHIADFQEMYILEGDDLVESLKNTPGCAAMFFEYQGQGWKVPPN